MVVVPTLYSNGKWPHIHTMISATTPLSLLLIKVILLSFLFIIHWGHLYLYFYLFIYFWHFQSAIKIEQPKMQQKYQLAAEVHVAGSSIETKLSSNRSAGLILAPNLQITIPTTLIVFKAFWILDLWVRGDEPHFHLKNVKTEGWQDYLAWIFIRIACSGSMLRWDRPSFEDTLTHFIKWCDLGMLFMLRVLIYAMVKWKCKFHLPRESPRELNHITYLRVKSDD